MTINVLPDKSTLRDFIKCLLVLVLDNTIRLRLYSPWLASPWQIETPTRSVVDRCYNNVTLNIVQLDSHSHVLSQESHARRLEAALCVSGILPMARQTMVGSSVCHNENVITVRHLI